MQLIGQEETDSLISKGCLPTKECSKTDRLLYFYSEEKLSQKVLNGRTTQPPFYTLPIQQSKMTLISQPPCTFLGLPPLTQKKTPQ